MCRFSGGAIKTFDRLRLAALFFALNACLISASFAASLPELERQVVTLDLYREENAVFLDGVLRNNSLLAYFAIREKLLSQEYDSLQTLRAHYKGREDLPHLTRLIDKVLAYQRERNIFYLCEDIYIDNVPMPGLRRHRWPWQKATLEDFDPQEEHFYLERLPLIYKQNRLTRADEDLWVNSRFTLGVVGRSLQTNSGPQESSFEAGTDFLVSSPHPRLAWARRLKNSLETVYFLDTRQWFKFYEESPLRPFFFGDAVLFRNEYRVFCVSLYDGKELWNFASANTEAAGYEFYQKFRPPNQNSFGYEMCLAGDTLFTELGGRFVALELKRGGPRLLWERSLGEYTLCAAPAQVPGGTVVTGLINSKKEIWACGFNASDGRIRWSTYIGISSALSPVCDLSFLDGDRLFLGFNHGFLVCLDCRNGSLVWVKKYDAKKYSLFDFWEKGWYRDRFVDGGSIAFDSQLLETAPDGRLYYKPRESEYLYILDRNTGRCLRRIRIETDSYCLVRINGTVAVFFAKPGEDGSAGKVLAVDLDSGEERASAFVVGGELKGFCKVPGTQWTIFKIGATIYIDAPRKPLVSVELGNNLLDDWLLGISNSGFLLMGNGDTLRCIDLVGGGCLTGLGIGLEATVAEFEERLGGLQSEEDIAAIERIVSSAIKETDYAFKLLIPSLIKHKEIFANRRLRDFFLRLLSARPRSYFGEYCGITIELKNFILSSASLTSPAPSPVGKTNAFRVRKDTGFLLEGAYLCFPVPVRIAREGGMPPDFLLFVRFDQLICVDEATHEIRWTRRIFYNPTNYMYLYHHCLEAYLFDDVLVVNDAVNAIGVRVLDGKYLWSLSNTSDLFKNEIQGTLVSLDPEEKTKQHILDQITEGYRREILIRMKVLDEGLLLAHRNRLLLVDPKTGFCKAQTTLDAEGFRDIAVGKEHILALLLSKPEVIIVRLDLSTQTRLPLSIPEIGQDRNARVFSFDGRIGILAGGSVYLCDAESGAVMESMGAAGTIRFVEVLGENLITIVPLQEVRIYGLESGVLQQRGNFACGMKNSPEGYFSFLDNPVVWKKALRYSSFYVVQDDCIYLPLSGADGGYLLSCVEIAGARERWRVPLSGFEGTFCYLSDIVSCAGRKIFLMATKAETADIVPCIMRIFSVEASTGAVERNEKLFTVNTADFKPFTISWAGQSIAFRIPPNTIKIEDEPLCRRR